MTKIQFQSFDFMADVLEYSDPLIKGGGKVKKKKLKIILRFESKTKKLHGILYKKFRKKGI